MKILAFVKLAFVFAAFVSFCCYNNGITFTAQHIYYMSPGGNDSNNGTSAGTPWLTPHGHSLVCGDVIIAASGTYTSTNFLVPVAAGATPWWSQPTSCPSSTLGIDGTGGIYAAAIVCATAFACNTSQIWIDASNWAIEGFVVTDTSANESVGMRATPIVASTNISYVAFINNVCSNASLGCFYGGPDPGKFSGSAVNSVDEFALIGNIAFNSSASASECGSGLSINNPSNVDTLAGTHIAVIGNYSYGNIDGLCGTNSGVNNGAFGTANGATSSGSSTVAYTRSSGVTAVAGYPVGVYNASNGIVTAGISQPNWTVAGTTSTSLALNTATSATISNGAQIALGLTTDGEGLIFDTWNGNSYAKQAYVYQNIFWGNGAHGFEMFCGGTTCASGLSVYVDHNTTYGNAQDYKRGGITGEIYTNLSAGISWTLSITNNIFQASVTTPFQSPNSFTGVPSTGSGMGNPVVAAIFSTGYTVSGNFFKSAASATCPTGATCNGTNDVANFNGSDYSSGNTFGTDAGFTSPGSLPTTAPSCSGQPNVYQCMVAAGVIADLTPSGSAASAGYQPPNTICATNAKYPAWTKGIVYLSWNGSSLTENVGLVSKPCGL